MRLAVEPQHDRTPEERDAPPERLEEEEAQRYPAHDDPERIVDPDPNE